MTNSSVPLSAAPAVPASHAPVAEAPGAAAGDALLGRVMQLNAAVEALAAIGAELRARAESITVDARVAPVLRGVVDAALAGAPLPRDEPTQRIVAGAMRTFLTQALDLLDHPGAEPGWTHTDAQLLQSQGRASMSMMKPLAAVTERLEGLAARLASSQPGAQARALDIGTGTGWLAIAMARQWPRLHIDAIDRHAPALALARANIDAAILADRITLHARDARDPGDPGESGWRDRFDLIWLPLPFIELAAFDAVLAATCAALAPGGWLIAGAYAGAGDALSEALADLRTVRSGGVPWRPDALLAALGAAGLANAHEAERRWQAPMRLFVAQRPHSQERTPR